MSDEPLVHVLDPAYPHWAIEGAKELCGEPAGVGSDEVYLTAETGDEPVDMEYQRARVTCPGCRSAMPLLDRSDREAVEAWLAT